MIKDSILEKKLRENFIKERCCLSPMKVDYIIDSLIKTHDLDGNYAEVGVLDGGISLMIAKTFKESVYMYDTWEGLPKCNKEKDGILYVEQLKRENPLFYLNKYNQIIKESKIYKNMILRKGYFPATIKEEKDLLFKFVHLDGDMYQTTIDGLEFFYNRMVKGGIIVMDDFKGKHTSGVRDAYNEFSNGKNIESKYTYRQLIIYK
jgi:hypothetical protein